MEKPRLLLVYSTQESQQLGKHVSLAVEQVILCVKYAGVQNKVPQKGSVRPLKEPCHVAWPQYWTFLFFNP